MLDANDTPTLGSWTRVEHYVFKALVAKTKREDTHNIGTDDIKNDFNNACHMLLSQGALHFSIGSKSSLQVKAKVAVHERTLFSFKEHFKQTISELFRKL